MDSHSTADTGLAGLEGRRRGLPALRPWVVQALAIALGYYLAARLGFLFTLQPHPISILWAPNALLAAALMLAPTRAWWWLVAAAFPAHLAAELQSGVPTAMVLGWFVSNSSEALIAAGLVRAFVPGALRLDSLRSGVAFLLAAVVAAPLLSSFLDAALVRLSGWGEAGYWDLVATRFPSNVLAELTIGPLILGCATLRLGGLRDAPRWRLLEGLGMFTALLAVCLLVFDLPHRDVTTPALFYAPLPFLLWAAVRLGPAGSALALAMLTIATISGATHGLGPFAGQPPQEAAHEMQLFLIAAAAPLLLLAAVLQDRANAEREASEQRRQLTHLSRVALLGELSGGIAHELNQPLTAILSNAQAAQHFIANKTADPALLGEILQDIILADQRAGDVIHRLRALFKRGETALETLDANALVHETLSLAQGDLATRGVELDLQLAQRLPLIRGDRIQLEQVLLNLIVNGAEAMAATARRARVLTVRTLATAAGVHLSVTDRGCGLPAAAEKLFEAFYTTKPKGLGLGLSISRSIVNAHGGRLWASTRRRGGATFLVTLPALPHKH